MLILTREERVSREQLKEHTPEGPHVDSHRVVNPEDNLRRAVESGLDVRVDPLVLETRGAEVNDLDARLVLLAEEDVLGLQVAVDDAQVF